ncbi:MAG: hypothetical protein KKG99_07410 [Bacteroidetes bacterium]|nr:hypothetical protein [Bacteroidota bacterium]
MIAAENITIASTGYAFANVDYFDYNNLRKNERSKNRIIIAKQTSPALTPFLLSAEGLLLQHGGVLSHAVIICRNIGIPCAVNVPPGLLTLCENRKVEIDGKNRTLRIYDLKE